MRLGMVASFYTGFCSLYDGRSTMCTTAVIQRVWRSANDGCGNRRTTRVTSILKYHISGIRIQNKLNERINRAMGKSRIYRTKTQTELCAKVEYTERKHKQNYVQRQNKRNERINCTE